MNTHPSSPWSWSNLVLLVLGLAAAGLVALGLWPRPAPVETAMVRIAPLSVSVTEEAKTRIRARHVIFAPVPGFLRRAELRAGDAVRAGQTVLARIIPEPAGILNPRAKAEAEARLHATEANIRLRRADLDRAAARRELARANFTRRDGLLRAEAIPRQDWDTAHAELQVARTEEQAAAFALNVATFEAAQAQASLLQTSAAEGPGAHTVTTLAPIDGCVLNLYEENARSVTPATAIMEVGDPRDLEIEVELLSSDAVAVAPGAEATLEDWGGEQPLHGAVSMVERGAFTKVSAIGVEEQRVKVRIELREDPPAERILGDRFGLRARITTWRSETALQIPTGALFRQGEDWKVFVVEAGQARLRTVGIGHANGLAAKIHAGLRRDEVVILHPPDSLREGMRVRAER